MLNNLSFEILPINLLEQYKSSFDKGIANAFENLHDSNLSIETFSFYTSVSAVFSSKIEGENIELDSFIKYKRFGVSYKLIILEKLKTFTILTYLHKKTN